MINRDHKGIKMVSLNIQVGFDGYTYKMKLNAPRHAKICPSSFGDTNNSNRTVDPSAFVVVAPNSDLIIYTLKIKLRLTRSGKMLPK